MRAAEVTGRPERPPTDYAADLDEVDARLEVMASLASQSLLGEISPRVALESIIGIVERSRLHLKAAGR